MVTGWIPWPSALTKTCTQGALSQLRPRLMHQRVLIGVKGEGSEPIVWGQSSKRVVFGSENVTLFLSPLQRTRSSLDEWLDTRSSSTRCPSPLTPAWSLTPPSTCPTSCGIAGQVSTGFPVWSRGFNALDSMVSWQPAPGHWQQWQHIEGLGHGVQKLDTDLPGHTDEVYAINWSPESQRVASGEDKCLGVWRRWEISQLSLTPT